MASYDVGVRYNCAGEKLLYLHPNIENFETNVNLYLNKTEECDYKLYFKNNTTLRCEVLIFIAHYESDYLAYASNHIIAEPDRPHFIGESNCLDKCYKFIPNYINKENVETNLNSYITVLVYPEIENALWHYKYGFRRNNKNICYTYKFKLVHSQNYQETGYFTSCK